MPIFRFSLVLILFTFMAKFSVAKPVDSVFPLIQIRVGQQVYSLEYAYTFELRAQGLMDRASLCESCGMLFKFDRSKVAGFWMKNTLIPLDIAFVRADGVITDIKVMQPHDLSSTKSSEQVLYAWEMNRGWFKQNAIKVGDSVIIPAK